MEKDAIVRNAVKATQACDIAVVGSMTTVGCEWQQLDRCVLFIALPILTLLLQWYRRLRM